MDVLVTAYRTSGCNASSGHILVRGIARVIRYSIWRFRPTIHPLSLRIVSRTLLGSGTSTPTTRTVLSARAAGVSEHRNTEIGFPPLHGPQLLRYANGIAPQRRRIGPCVRLGGNLGSAGCPVLPVPHHLLSNVLHDAAIAGTFKLLHGPPVT